MWCQNIDISTIDEFVEEYASHPEATLSTILMSGEFKKEDCLPQRVDEDKMECADFRSDVRMKYLGPISLSNLDPLFNFIYDHYIFPLQSELQQLKEERDRLREELERWKMIKGIDDLEAENSQLREEIERLLRVKAVTDKSWRELAEENERLRVRLAYWQNECEFLTQQSKK